MSKRFAEIAGFVLAGGLSKRMGRPKWDLVLSGETMLERQVRLLGAVARTVAVLGASESLAVTGMPVFLDDWPGRGPLGAVYTALARTRSEFNLFLSCDMPFVEARFLRFLCGRALAHQADVTVPETPERGYQPLCAVYRRRALWAVQCSLRDGQNKMTSFYSRLRVAPIRWPEIARAGFDLRVFENMNTPADYEAAHKKLSAMSGR